MMAYPPPPPGGYPQQVRKKPMCHYISPERRHTHYDVVVVKTNQILCILCLSGLLGDSSSISSPILTCKICLSVWILMSRLGGNAFNCV